MKFRDSALLTLLLPVAVSGCLYAPPVWDLGDEIYAVSNLREGVSTKEDVLDYLGAPGSGGTDGDAYGYFGNWSAGAWFITDGSNAAGGLFGEEAWSIRITFDESDFVETIWTSENPLEEEPARKARENKAEEGDDEAAYQIGRWTTGPDRWHWFCFAANRGHEVAQYKIGRSFETASNPDYLAAFLWYSAAAVGRLPAAPSALERVSCLMSPEQIADGEQLAAVWRPNPGSCEGQAPSTTIDG